MKQGKTLQELAAELDRQNDAKRDYIAPATKLSAIAEVDGGAITTALNLRGIEAFPINPHAHGQLANYLDIPKKYYDRMVTDAPGVWAVNVNRWLEDHSSEQRMVRTLDSSVRALMSDKFRTLENFDLATAILPELSNIGNLDVTSCEVTERRMYIKAVDKDRVKTFSDAAESLGLTPGKETHFMDLWSPAVTIQNSEVGAGTLAISGSGYCHGCTNLTVFSDGQMKKYHVGTRADVSENVYAMLTDETKAKSDEAVWLQARDVTRAAFNEEMFAQHFAAIAATAGNAIEGPVTEVINRAADKFGFSKDEGNSVLEHLIRGGDMSQYGLHNAVTRMAQDVDGYDRASDIERIGGRIIELPRNEWERLAA